MKKDHMAEISESIIHEIRTPMNGIIGALELLQQTSPTHQQQNLLAIMRTSADYMLDVINNSFNFKEINYNLGYELVDLFELIDKVMVIVSFEAKRKGLALSTYIYPDTPKKVRVSQISLMQILINLIGNAIKFTTEGSIKIKVGIDKSNLVFDIIDTGIGIDISQQNKIFKPFFKVNLNENGSGLGLSISANLIKLMNGKIKIQSQLGKGTHFKLYIPMKSDECLRKVFNSSAIKYIGFGQQLRLWEINLNLGKSKLLDYSDFNVPSGFFCNNSSGFNRKHKGKQHNLASSTLWSLKILVVDDVSLNQNIIKIILENMGHQVDLASSGSIAIDLGKKNIYDMVLMDLNMPMQNGFETLLRWRTLENEILDNDTPIIATTAGDRGIQYNDNTNVKFNDCLLKPFNIDRLSDLIEKVIIIQLGRGIELAKNKRKNDAIININECDDLRSRFKSTFEQFSTQIEIAWHEKQGNKFLAVLHSIKGCAALTGINGIYDACQYLESKVKIGEWSEKDKHILLEQISLYC